MRCRRGERRRKVLVQGRESRAAMVKYDGTICDAKFTAGIEDPVAEVVVLEVTPAETLVEPAEFHERRPTRKQAEPNKAIRSPRLAAAMPTPLKCPLVCGRTVPERRRPCYVLQTGDLV